MKSTLVRAGAGAGKTTALVDQLLKVAKEFFSLNHRWPRVVVSTFTNKATQELKERLLKKCVDEQESLLDFLDESLHVSTLHGVLSLFLKKHGTCLEVLDGKESDFFLSSLSKSFSFEFAIMNEKEVRGISKSILKDLLFERQKKSQRLFKDFGFERLLNILLSWHRAYLESPFIKPHDEKSFLLIYQEQIKLWREKMDSFFSKNLIFNQKEDENLKKNIRPLLESLESLFQDPKKENELFFLETLNQVLFFLKEQKKQFKRKVQKGDFSFSPFLEDFILFLKDVFLQCKKESFKITNWPLFFDAFKEIECLARPFHFRLMSYKIHSQRFEIDDLERLSLRLIEQRPEKALAFAQQWDYWLIDEYQDTSPLQDKIFKSFIRNTACFIVGDPNQSIYLFRGASSEVFKETEKRMEEKKAEIVLRNKNYRASPELLIFLNDFFHSFHDSFEKMEPRKKRFHAKEKVAYFAIGREKESELKEVVNKRDLHFISHSSSLSSKGEALALIRHIQNLKAKGESYKDICVLGRTHKVLKEISLFLEIHKIPFSLQGKSSFYERREILDARALLKFLVNPHDNFNLIHLLRSPLFYLSDQDILDHLTDIRASFWEKFSKLNPPYPSISRLNTYLDWANEEGIVIALKKAFVHSGFIDSLSLYDQTGKAEANFWKWFLELEEKERKKGFNPLQFVDEAETGGEDFSREEDETHFSFVSSERELPSPMEMEKVSLLTIHAAKGLSFKHILLPFLHLGGSEKKLNIPFWTLNSSLRWSVSLPLGEGKKWTISLGEEKFLEDQKKREREELNRLLYVALTRAELTVFLSWTKKAHSSFWVRKIEEIWDLKEGVHEKEKYSYFVFSDLNAHKSGARQSH